MCDNMSVRFVKQTTQHFRHVFIISFDNSNMSGTMATLVRKSISNLRNFRQYRSLCVAVYNKVSRQY